MGLCLNSHQLSWQHLSPGSSRLSHHSDWWLLREKSLRFPNVFFHSAFLCLISFVLSLLHHLTFNTFLLHSAISFCSVLPCTQAHTCFGLEPKANYPPNMWGLNCRQIGSGSAFFGATFVKAHGLFLNLRKNMPWESFVVTKEETLRVRPTPSLQGSLIFL